MSDIIQDVTAPDRRADALKREIAGVRGDIMDTIGAIQDRFRPRRLIARAGQSMAASAVEAVDEVRRLQRDHPVDVERWKSRLARHPVAVGAVAGSLLAVFVQLLARRRREPRHIVRSS